MNELDALMIKNCEGTPLKNRRFIIIGGRFIMRKEKYANLQACASCNRVKKAIRNTYLFKVVFYWLDRILEADK